jgi:hypothetical protein
MVISPLLRLLRSDWSGFVDTSFSAQISSKFCATLSFFSLSLETMPCLSSFSYYSTAISFSNGSLCWCTWIVSAVNKIVTIELDIVAN